MGGGEAEEWLLVVSIDLKKKKNERNKVHINITSLKFVSEACPCIQYTYRYIYIREGNYGLKCILYLSWHPKCVLLLTTPLRP